MSFSVDELTEDLRASNGGGCFAVSDCETRTCDYCFV